MAAEDALPQGRSFIRALRTDILASEQRSFFASKINKKSQPKPSSDKLVWFSPVHSPLLSPAREKTRQASKKKARQSSIFSIQSRGKASIEAEEPTSPKVSCIGQVRAQRKEKDPLADAAKKKSSFQSKPGSMSPARFFSSPARSSKWGSLFGSRKDSGASTPTSSGYGEGEVSCFGWPFESRSAFQTDKTCAFLARSLDVFQECGNSDNHFYNARAAPAPTNEPRYPLKNQGIYSSADGCVGTLSNEEMDLRACVTTRDSHSVSQMKGAHGHDQMSSTSLVDGGQHGGKKLSINPEHCQQEESLVDDRCYGKPPAAKQRLKYEELPSLHFGASAKPNMKVSVEVVPETWLWRNGERLRPDSASHLSCVPERSVSTSREDLDASPGEVTGVTNPVSPCGNAQAFAGVAEEPVNHQIMPVQSVEIANQHVQSGSTSLADAISIHVEDTTGKEPVTGCDENKNDLGCAFTTESSQSHAVALPCSTDVPMTVLEEESEELRGSHGSYEEGSGAENGKQQVLSKKCQSESDLGKNRDMSGSFEVKPSHQMTRRCDADVGKENYGLALPQLLEKNLPPLHSVEEGKCFSSFFKSSKSKAFTPQPFSALILVGYNQSMASKDIQHTDEELLKGILEVGRLSFHGSGKYFQVLNGDVAFNRSRSATSHRTVIRLQRCNSDPCRPSY